jgi:hypothetical protein
LDVLSVDIEAHGFGIYTDRELRVTGNDSWAEQMHQYHLKLEEARKKEEKERYQAQLGRFRS